MRLLTCFLIVMIFGCNDKKTDTELFSEGKTRVTLLADPSKGYEPLEVYFEAYLENRERVLTDEITDVRWVIKGPNDFFREVEMTSNNYQEDGNEKDAFYFDFRFFRHGKYTVKLILNEGQYVSNPKTINVLERETEHRRRGF